MATMSATVMKILSDHPTGISADDLVKATGYKRSQIFSSISFIKDDLNIPVARNKDDLYLIDTGRMNDYLSNKPKRGKKPATNPLPVALPIPEQSRTKRKYVRKATSLLPIPPNADILTGDDRKMFFNYIAEADLSYRLAMAILESRSSTMSLTATRKHRGEA